MLCIYFVLFLKGQILREYQNIEKLVISRKKKIKKKAEWINMFPILISIEAHRKRLDLMKNLALFRI